MFVAVLSPMAQMKNPSASASLDDTQRLVGLVRKFDTAMLVTHTHEGLSRARPMAVADVSDAGDVWFVTRIETPKVDEIRDDDRVLVVLQGSSQYLSLAGEAKTIRDQALIHKLWSESWRVWFKDPNDANLALIQVKPHEAEYWDQSGVKGVKYLLRAAKAYVSGKPLAGSEADAGQHGKVKL
jgi:general stress protein 26